MRWAAFSAILFVGGCSGFLQPSGDKMQALTKTWIDEGIAKDAFVRRLERRGFEHLDEPLHQSKDVVGAQITDCFGRSLNYGFWAGGQRYICFSLTKDGAIHQAEIFDFVAGL